VEADDRGVTETIATVVLVGVVLVVAVTVGTVVFSEADSAGEVAPNAAFSVDTCRSCPSVADPAPGSTTNFVNVSFEAGQPIPADRLSVTVDGTTVFDADETGPDAYAQPANYDGAGDNDLRWSSDRVKAGERLVLEDDADAEPAPENRFSPGDTVRVVWTDADGERSIVLHETTIPG
jgi:flagellin-like protein